MTKLKSPIRMKKEKNRIDESMQNVATFEPEKKSKKNSKKPKINTNEDVGVEFKDENSDSNVVSVKSPQLIKTVDSTDNHEKETTIKKKKTKLSNSDNSLNISALSPEKNKNADSEVLETQEKTSIKKKKKKLSNGDSSFDTSVNMVSLKKGKHLDSEEFETPNKLNKSIKNDEKLDGSEVIDGKEIGKKKNRKRKQTSSESNKKLSVLDKVAPRKKKAKTGDVVERNNEPQKETAKVSLEEALDKYPILKDKEFISKFKAVKISNNQKGRIRQQLGNYFKSTCTADRIPDAINIRLNELVGKEDLVESDFRKMRVLHNMLQTAVNKMVEIGVPLEVKKKKKNKKNKKRDEPKPETDNAEGKEGDSSEKPDQTKKEKKKGPKRYTVFVGNLPYDIDKDDLSRHFSNVVSQIKDVRIPKKSEHKLGGIAYIELKDEASFQMALSKHHTMLQNRRINVLYTTTGDSKIDKSEAKGKRAKLLAMQKSGQLLGSAPLASKRSARRKKQKAAQAREEPA